MKLIVLNNMQAVQFLLKPGRTKHKWKLPHLAAEVAQAELLLGACDSTGELKGVAVVKWWDSFVKCLYVSFFSCENKEALKTLLCYKSEEFRDFTVCGLRKNTLKFYTNKNLHLLV